MNKNSYLLYYNAISAVIWVYIFYKALVDEITYYGENSTNLIAEKENNIYITHKYHDYPHEFLCRVQLANSVIEIVHVLTGLVRTPLSITLIQAFSRMVITLGVCWYLPDSPANYNIHTFNALSFAWSLAEIIRYSFYASKIITRDSPPPYIVWVRYSAFLVLYPLGLYGEMATIYQSIPAAPTTGYKTWLYINLASYLPLFPQLYLHMLLQRKKVLGSKPKVM